MAILPNLASSLTPNLANAATLGNPQAQQAQQSESLAELLAQYQRAQANLQRADRINADYVPNSGALGVLSSAISSYMGGRIRRKEGETATQLAQRILEAQDKAAADKALAKDNQAREAERQKIAERLEVIRRGDPNELLAYGIKTGNEPGGELIRDPNTGAYFRVQGTQAIPVAYGQQQIQGADGTPVSIDPSLPPEVQAAIRADEGSFATMPEVRIGGGQFRTGDKPESGGAPRDTFRLATADEISAAGFPAGTTAQINQSTGKLDVLNKPEKPAAAGGGVKALGVEAANKVGLYDNAIRAARQWFDLVAEKDANGRPTGNYNDVAARSPQAMRLLDQSLRAKLRAESGASISQDEIEGEVNRYAARLLASDATNLQGASALLNDLVTQRKSLIGGPGKAPTGDSAPSGRIRYDAQGNRIQ